MVQDLFQVEISVNLKTAHLKKGSLRIMVVVSRKSLKKVDVGL